MATRKIKRPLRIVKRGRSVVGRRREDTSTVLKRHGTYNAQGNPIEPILAGRKSRVKMGRDARWSRGKNGDGSPRTMEIPERQGGNKNPRLSTGTRRHGYRQVCRRRVSKSEKSIVAREKEEAPRRRSRTVVVVAEATAEARNEGTTLYQQLV